MPWLALAIAAGAGVLKSELSDRPKEERDRQLAANTQRFSPWTKLVAKPIREADPLGSALTYGAMGAQFGQDMQNHDANLALKQANTRWLNAGGSPALTASVNQTVAATQNPLGQGPAMYTGYGYRPSPWGFGNFNFYDNSPSKLTL